MANNRIFYAVHQVGMAEVGSQTFTELHGVQSVGITTTFNLEQVFELGQIEIYENIENIPDVEVTLEKVLDGYPLIYHMATRGSASPSLSGRSNAKTIVGLSVFGDTQDSASGAPLSEVQMSGMFVSALTYTFPVDGNCTESVTMVGNNKVWVTAGFAFTGAFDNTDFPVAVAGSGGVNRREDVIFDQLHTGPTVLDVNGSVAVGTGANDFRGSVLPQDIDGISSSGTNDRDSEGNFGAHIQNITVSTDLGREELFELGRRGPYFRFVSFPTEVTSEFEVISTRGDLVSATEDGVLGNGNNLSDRTIFIRTRDGSTFNLSTRNKLASTTYGGGDATGGNVSVTYSYSNFNALTVEASHDPTAALRIPEHMFT